MEKANLLFLFQVLISGGPGGAHRGLRNIDSLAKSNIQFIYFDAFGRGKSDTAKDVKEYTLERDEYCPQAKFIMFERSGHNPQEEEPEKEFPIIVDFMKK